MTSQDRSVKAEIKEPQRTREAIKACGYWLAECRRLGWRHEDWDWLERLWWKYHNHRGELVHAQEREP